MRDERRWSEDWGGSWDEGASRPGERVYGVLSDASEQLRTEFLESDDRRYSSGKCAGCALDLLLAFAEVVSLGGTMRWDARTVGHLLRVWAPGIAKDCGAADAMPTVLAAFVRFVHRREGADPVTSREVAREIHEAVQDGIGTVTWSGRATTDPWLREASLRDAQARDRERLAASVGGPDALAALDAEPLPDEEFVWGGIAEDIRTRVAEHLLLLDEVADEHLDVEHRTAIRRVLARAARAEPEMFRRPTQVLRGAIGIALAVCEANDTIASFRRGANHKVLAGWFGATGAAPDRAASVRHAIGAPSTFGGGYDRSPPALGSADLLISARRAKIIAQRDADANDADANDADANDASETPC
ncbi:hypothetical protein [Demequina maris]|uniref:hypothetical protein n=1 Tax=Demequina maris TaxID=1638982 RepID=UPI000785F446|nr:hypothetical protein [Demequina maris]